MSDSVLKAIDEILVACALCGWNGRFGDLVPGDGPKCVCPACRKLGPTPTVGGSQAVFEAMGWIAKGDAPAISVREGNGNGRT